MPVKAGQIQGLTSIPSQISGKSWSVTVATEGMCKSVWLPDCKAITAKSGSRMQCSYLFSQTVSEECQAVGVQAVRGKSFTLGSETATRIKENQSGIKDDLWFEMPILSCFFDKNNCPSQRDPASFFRKNARQETFGGNDDLHTHNLKWFVGFTGKSAWELPVAIGSSLLLMNLDAMPAGPWQATLQGQLGTGNRISSVVRKPQWGGLLFRGRKRDYSSFLEPWPGKKHALFDD